MVRTNGRGDAAVTRDTRDFGDREVADLRRQVADLTRQMAVLNARREVTALRRQVADLTRQMADPNNRQQGTEVEGIANPFGEGFEQNTFHGRRWELGFKDEISAETWSEYGDPIYDVYGDEDEDDPIYDVYEDDDDLKPPNNVACFSETVNTTINPSQTLKKLTPFSSSKSEEGISISHLSSVHIVDSVDKRYNIHYTLSNSKPKIKHTKNSINGDYLPLFLPPTKPSWNTGEQKFKLKRIRKRKKRRRGRRNQTKQIGDIDEALTKYSNQYEAEKGNPNSYGLSDFTLFSSVSDPNSGYVYSHAYVLRSVDTLLLHESITFNSNCNCATRLGWNDYMKITNSVSSKIGSSLDDTVVFRSCSCALKVFDEMSKRESVVVDMYAKYGMASLGFERLQASAITGYCRFLLFGSETGRLKVQVAALAQIVAEPELAGSETMIFKTKIIFAAQQHKGHTINIKERVSRMQEQDRQDFVDISVKMMDSMGKYDFVVTLSLVPLLANLNAETQIHNMGHTISAFKLVPALLFLCGKEFFWSVASEQLPPFSTSPQWQKHHVVLLGLVQIEEDCYEVRGRIVNLSYLYPGKNRFRGPIPESISVCQSPKTLNFGVNNLGGRLPTNLKNLQYLESVTLEAALGVGFTGSLASIPQKRGDHRFHLSTRTSKRLWSSTVTLSKGLRSREEEDSVSSHVLIQAIANACKVLGEFSSGLTETEVPAVHAMKFSEEQELEQLINGQICYKIYPFSAEMHKTVEERKIILPGSFNPLHDGHLKLLEVAASICGNGYPCFELSAINADKPPLSVLEIKNRVKQFEAVGKTIIISSQPYFYKKAELFPEKLSLIQCESILTIPKTVGNLESLVELFVCGTGIQELPASIGSLKYLKHFNLRDCKSLSSLPDSIGGLVSLVELQLDNTPINELPSQIGSMESLQNLHMLGCTGLKSLPELIGSMWALTGLYLDGSAVAALPSSIHRLDNLVFLHLNGCTQLHKLPDKIGHLKSLKYICMQDTAVTELSDSFGRLSSLILLTMFKKPLLRLPNNVDSGRDTGFTKLPMSFSHLSSLKELDARRFRIYGHISDDFEKLSLLEMLNIGNNYLTSLPFSMGGLYKESGSVDQTEPEKESLLASQNDVPTLVPMEEITLLEPGQQTKRTLQVHFHHHLLPLKLAIYRGDKKLPVKLRSDIGYFDKPLPLSIAVFVDNEARLPGMFEYIWSCTFTDHMQDKGKTSTEDKFLVICDSIALKMLSNTNLSLVSVDMPVSSSLNDASALTKTVDSLARTTEGLEEYYKECAESQDYSVQGMLVWCTLLHHGSGSNHVVSKIKYHLVIPTDKECFRKFSSLTLR